METMETTKIIKLLNISPQDYESKTWDFWVRYTKCYAYDSERDWQKLLANSSLNSFFLRQKTYLERKFIEDFEAFTGKVSPADLQRAYNYEVGVRLLTYRSPALFSSARKLTITTQLN